SQSRADRGAAQGARQARRAICRESADRRAQRPPRRDGASQGRREKARDKRGRAQTARARGPEAHRRDNQGDRRSGRDQGNGNTRQVTSAPAPTEGAAGIGSGTRVPRHVAIIMDGNGRWAKQRGLPRAAGHRAGAEAVRRAMQAAVDNGVEVLTLYAFSSENWRRSTEEI